MFARVRAYLCSTKNQLFSATEEPNANEFARNKHGEQSQNRSEMKQFSKTTYLPEGTEQIDGVEWENRQDAVWYHGYGEVAKVTLTTENGDTYAVSIHCDGETKVQLPDGFPLTYVRYADEWETIGVNTDKEMTDFTQKMLANGVDIWVHNSWFDIYAEIDGQIEHLDAVTHEITDAHNQARAILQEVASLGGWENYKTTYG